MPTADDVRAAVFALPEATEKETWDHPTFRVRNKMFGSMAADGSTATFKAAKEEQAALVGEFPDVFFVPPYVGQHGWVGFHLDRVDPQELQELIEEAWRMTAPKRVVKAFDGGA